jgi:SWI/SNF-related matrix-associated actin-dependent regulator of chromatin subfamily A3
MDRSQLTMADLIEPLTPSEIMFTQAPYPEQDESTSISSEASSAKIDQLIQMLCLNPGTEKSLVFSQFTSFLDKVSNLHGLTANLTSLPRID